jgi:hypothetical protein
MRNLLLCFIFCLLLVAIAWRASATNASTANPAYPAAFEDIDSDPLREQFDKLINDIDNIWAAIGPNFLEANQILGALISGKATALSMPSCFSLTNALTWRPGLGFGCNDIQGGGGSLNPASALTVVAGPPSGSPAVPSAIPLTGDYLPLPSANSIGGVKSASAAAHQFMSGISTSGSPLFSTPAFTDISGTLGSSQLPTPSASSLGGVESIAVVPHNFVTGISAFGAPTQAQPGFADIFGNISISQMGSGAGASSATFWRGDGTWSSLTASVNPIAGATAEYPFNEGSGTVVNDISGNGNTASFGAGAAPIWTTFGTSYNSVIANPVNQYVQTPVKTWKTLIVNTCAVNYPLGGTTFFYHYPPHQTVAGASDAIFLSGAQALNQQTASTLYPGIGFSGAISTSGVTPTKLCSNVAWVVDSADHVYVDGQEASYSTQGASSSHVTTSTTGYSLGSTGVGASFFYVGYINYAVFYPGVLSQAQIVQEIAYINSKVEGRPSYPTSLVGFSGSVTPTVVCGGDSIMAGASSVSWCNNTFVTPLVNSYTFLTYAFGGDSAGQELSVLPARAYPLIPVNAPTKYCPLLIGTNDIGGGQFQSVNAAWGAILNLGRMLKATGCSPIVGTILSRGPAANTVGDPSGAEPAKNTINALIRQNWRTVFAALDDNAAIPVLGADGAYANSACFNSDQLHPNNSGSCYNGLGGSAVLGWNLARVINILDGSTEENPTITASNAYIENIGDNYVLQTPTGSATNQLPDCTGLTSTKRHITNGSSSFTITVNTSASQTITGSNSIAPNTTAIFVCSLISASAAGDYWLRTQ